MAMAAALSPEVQLMRRRIRHIHIPDLPPTYAPRGLAPTIRDHIQGQITRQRAQRALIEEQPRTEGKYGFAKVTSKVQTSFTDWVKSAGPPPTVLSFTRRPTYILPKHRVEAQEPWQVEYLTKALKSTMNVHFPEPPGWSSLPWRPFWEQKMPESEWKHNPLNHQWPDVGVLVMPCAEAMFLGPGQVSIWPIIDLKDDIQKGRARMTTKYQFERILEDTTIEILKREFHIEAFAIPGSTGVWVESRIPPAEVDVKRSEGGDVTSASEDITSSRRRKNLRQIATIHTSVTDDITQWGVSIHVGQPHPTADAWERSTNPWIPIRQHHTTTSIAAELCYMRSTASPLGSRKYLSTHFNHDAMPLRAGQGYMPYSRIKVETGLRCPAPLGMDNREISTAWTYEFARQLGMSDGLVDHYGMVEENDANATHLPTKASEPGFKFRGVFAEDEMTSTYRQVDVPSIQVGQNERVAPGIVATSLRLEHHDRRIDSTTHNGWLLSWPLWESTLLKKLDEAICGGPCDTRIKTYHHQKQLSSRLQRRRNELQRTKEVEEEWRRDMPQLIRRPLVDGVVRELADRSREMEGILKTVRIGKKSEKLLDNTIQIRRLLERRFAGAFSGNAGGPEPPQGDDLAAPGASPDAAPTAQVNASEAPSDEAPTAQISASSAGEQPQAREIDPADLEQKVNELMQGLQDQVKDSTMPLRRQPRDWVEFSKPKAEEQRERRSQRRREKGERRRQAYAETAFKVLDLRDSGLVPLGAPEPVGKPKRPEVGMVRRLRNPSKWKKKAPSEGFQYVPYKDQPGGGEEAEESASDFLPKTQQIGGGS